MNSSPILIEEKDGMFLGMIKKAHRNEKITQLIEYTKKLKKLDQVKKAKAGGYKAVNDKDKILNDIINILAEGDKQNEGQMFQYSDEFDLIRAQYAMIEIALHCLMFVETVRYEFRRDYYEIISQILNRDELKLTNVALGPEMEEHKSLDLLAMHT